MSDTRPTEGILDHIEIGITVQDADLRILYMNAAGCRLLGRTQEDLLSRDSHDTEWDAIDADGKPISGDQHPAGVAAATGESVRGQVIGVRIPSREDRIWLLVNSSPRLDPLGEVESVLSTFAEVTAEVARRADLASMNELLSRAVEERSRELTETTERLSETASRYEAVVRAMAEGVVIHGPDGGILDANPSALEILGLTMDQLRGLHPFDPHWALTREDGSELPGEEIPSEITRTTGRACANRILHVRRGIDERAWLSVNTDPIVVNGEMLGVVATFTDVTTEREALRRLAETNRTFEWVHQMMPGALVESRYHPDGRSEITYASPGVETVMGLSPAELLGDPTLAWSRIHPDDAASMQAQLAERMRPGAEVDPDGPHSVTEYRYSDGDGGWRWLRAVTSPATRVSDEIVFHSFIVDITVERELDRTLRESQRREFMGTLAAGIAHNFNNMLAAILPTLESARSRTEGPLSVELDSAYQAATAASELVRRLARLSRDEATVEVVSVPMREIVDEIVQICTRTFDRAIEIADTVGEGPHTVMGRRAELQQVVLNLALNARDALEGAADPRIEVRLSASEDGSRVVLEVEDNGSGMSTETQARLGEPFFTTKEAGRGTGLGLASLIGTVRDLGGEVTWTSTLGEGSCFRVELPATVAPSASTDSPDDEKPKGVLEGRRVLCVDDEPLVRTSLERMLGRLGGEVIEAASGPEALERIAEGPVPDLVLIDLSMPGMSGDEAAVRMRADHPDLPIVLMSGYLPGDAPAEVSAVLSKPFTSKKLAEKLAKVLT